MLKNTDTGYGWVAIAFHWVIALGVFSLFALGYWMVELDYYHDWYQRAPDLHRSFGVILVVLMALRLGWRSINTTPRPPADHKRWERRAASLVHGIFYLLVFSMFVSGYLITTAKGQALSVFDWFGIPALVTGVDRLEDYAGAVHQYLAYSLMFLAGIHALAAVKHEVIDRDGTLMRMVSGNRK